MYCSYCGKVLRQDAVFCSYCGKPVPPLTEEPVEMPVLAPEPVQTPERPAETQERPAETQELTAEVSEPTVEAPEPETQELPAKTSRRADTVYLFASVPEEWQSDEMQRTVGAMPFVPPRPATPETPAVKPTETVREKAAEYGEKAKEQAIRLGSAAKEKAVQVGGAAKEQVKKLGAVAKEKATEGVERLQAAQKKNPEKRVLPILTIASAALLLLILLAVFVPYCRIAYSAERAANMPLWKLMFGGTYTMGSTNPLQFTLRAHPELLALVLIPPLVLLPLFVRKAKARLWIASGTLFAVGLIVLIWNGAALQSIQSTVAGLSLKTFERDVVSMNGLVIQWVRNVLAEGRSFANTFFVTGRLGHGLITLFGWIVLLLGAAGATLGLVLLIARRKATEELPDEEPAEEPDEEPAEEPDEEPDADDDVPECKGEWL